MVSFINDWGAILALVVSVLTILGFALKRWRWLRRQSWYHEVLGPSLPVKKGHFVLYSLALLVVSLVLVLAIAVRPGQQAPVEEIAKVEEPEVSQQAQPEPDIEIPTTISRQPVESPATQPIEKTVTRPEVTPQTDTGAAVHVPAGQYYADAVQLSPTGKYIAVSDFDWNVNVYHAGSGLPAARLTGHEGRVFSMSFSPEEDLIATGSSDGTVRIWSIGKRTQIRMFRPEADKAFDQLQSAVVAFSPDGRELAFAGNSRTINIVRVGDGKLTTSYDTQQAIRASSADRDLNCDGIGLSPSPECILASRAARDRFIRDVSDQDSASAPVEAISYSGDGRYLATISHGQDSDVQVYDLQAQRFQWRQDFRQSAGLHPRRLAFSPAKNELAVMGVANRGSSPTRKILQVLSAGISGGGETSVLYQSGGNVSDESALSLDYSTDGSLLGFTVPSGVVVFDINAGIARNEIVGGCLHRHIQLAGGSPTLFAADFCDDKGITIKPLDAF